MGGFPVTYGQKRGLAVPCLVAVGRAGTPVVIWASVSRKHDNVARVDVPAERLVPPGGNECPRPRSERGPQLQCA